MSIIYNEFRKLCSSKILLIIFILLALNPILQLYNIKANEAGSYKTEKYLEECKKLEAMKTDEAAEYLTECEESARLYQDMVLYQELNDELQDIITYEDYINSFEERADNIAILNINSSSGDFSKKNAEKTKAAFEKLKGRKLQFSNSKGVLQVTDCDVTNYIGMIIMLILAIAVVFSEKEENQIALIRSNLKGRIHIMAAKTVILILFTAVTIILLYMTNLIIGQTLYGLGDLSRWIQCVYGYKGSPFRFTVKQYLAVYFLIKFVGFLLLAVIFEFICAKLNSIISIFASALLIISVEFICCYTISETSFLAFLKYCNIIYFAKTNPLFAKYINCNILSMPINIWLIFIVFTLIVGGTCIYKTIVSLNVPEEGHQKQYIKKLAEKLSLNEIQHTSLLAHEGFKSFIVGKALFILIVLVAFSYGWNRPMNKQYDSMDEIYFMEYMDMLCGEANEKSNSILEKEQVEFDKIESEIDEAIDQGEDIEFLQIRYQKKLEKQGAFEQVKMHAEYLQDKEGSWYLPDKGYRILTDMELVENRAKEQAFIYVFVVILIAFGLYGIDYNNSEINLISTTVNGTRKLNLVKFLWGFIGVLATWAIVYLPHLYNVLKTYGIKGLMAPAYSLEKLYFVPGWMTIALYLAVVFVLRIVAGIIVVKIVEILYRLLKKNVSVLIVSSVIFILPLLFVYLNIPFAKYLFLNPILLGL